MLSPAVQAQEVPARLGAGTFTFPEIAEKLSVGIRTVKCASAIRNRAALIRLADHPWETATRLLSSSLDVRFTKQESEPNLWVMEPEPAIAERERSWRRLLISALKDELNAEIDGRVKFGESYAATYHRYDSLHAELEAALKDNGEKLEQSQRLRDAGRADRNSSQKFLPEAWLAARILKNGLSGDYSEIVKRELPFRRVDPRLLADRESLEAIWAVASRSSSREPYQLEKLVEAYPLPEDFAVYAGMGFEPKSFVLRFDVALLGGGKVFGPNGLGASTGWLGGAAGVESVFKGDRKLLNGFSYAGLGELPVKWLLQEEKDTAAFLRSDSARESFKWMFARPADSVSDLVEAWAAQGHHEVIMELNPLREGKYAKYWQGFPKTEPGMSYSLADMGAVKGSWTFRDQSGVLFVKNRVAFVDRGRNYALAGFVKLSRRLVSKADTAESGDDLPLAAALDFAREVDPLSFVSWRDTDNYRGVPMGRLLENYPVLALLNRQTEKTRSALFDSVAMDKPVELMMADLPETVLVKFVADYFAPRVKDAVFRQSGTLAAIRASRLQFTHITSDDGKKRRLMARLSPRDDAPDSLLPYISPEWPLGLLPAGK